MQRAIPPDGFDAAALESCCPWASPLEVTLYGRTPPPASLVPLVLSGPLCPVGISPPRGESPFSREAYILLANAVFKKLDHLHQKTLEYQHYRYRQGQQPALASPRRTARYERIPPDGFGVAALESTLCGRTPPPPSGGPPPLSGEAYTQVCGRCGHLPLHIPRSHRPIISPRRSGRIHRLPRPRKPVRR